MHEPNAPRPLPLGTITVYAAPMLGTGFVFFFLSTYLMKFATDVLLISPVVMGAILGVSRLWDAFSDPLAGYLSDRTRTRLGRRRPWLLAGALPMAASFTLVFSPPAFLEERGLAVWTGVFVVLFYTMLTVVMMPHDSLGAELSTRYEDRNRIFGWRRIFFGMGALAVFGVVSWLASQPDPRSATAWVAFAAAALTGGLFIFTGLLVRERPEHQGRGATSVTAALLDVARNPHARTLIQVFFLQQLGVGMLVASMAYYTDYVLGDAAVLGSLLGVFFVASIVSVPVWVSLGNRFEKKQLALWAMCGIALVLSALLVLGEGDLLLMHVVAVFGGAAGGCLDVVFPSIQADVIDFDEYQTGERKEGVYFSVWALAAKTAAGLAGLLIGLALSVGGFVPNAEQSDAALLAIRLMVAAAPVACYSAGTLIFLRFRLDRRAHEQIRVALDARAHPGS